MSPEHMDEKFHLRARTCCCMMFGGFPSHQGAVESPPDRDGNTETWQI